MIARVRCRRCGHVLVAEDECGWYYQVPRTWVGASGEFTFMDRVHECEPGVPHDVIVEMTK